MSGAIHVLYFASLREQLGREAETLPLPESVTDVGGLREWICERGEDWADRFSNRHKLMTAVNQEMARLDTPVADGDEVAFFPPVTGG